MTGTDPTRRFAHEMAALLRAGETSSRAITEAHLEVAERQNRALNAWLVIDRAGALAQADAADDRLAAARRHGTAALDALHPLHGIPVGLKDLISVEGGQCTAGSRILAGYVAPYDAHIVERLRTVGAVLLGKTNMDEFAMGSSNEYSAYGPVSNPWDLDTVPGGSSGGSAAAVAAYHVPLALGTDTGGSIRQPAALCGIVGMKPTYGRVSRYGIVAFASSLDQIGPLARDTRDAAALLHAVAGRDAHDSTSAPVPVPDELLALPESDDEAVGWLRGKRFGLPREYFVAGMDPDVERLIRVGVSVLEGAGATVEDVSLPHTDYGLATYYIVAPAEASANLARYDGIRYGHSRRLDGADFIEDYLATRGEGFGAEVKRRIMLGTYALSAGYYDAFYLKAQKVRTLIKRDFDEVFASGIDALVAPTSPSVAFRFGAKIADPVAMYLSDACTLPVNMAGLPGVSIPCGLSDGLPVGLQLIGPAWSELMLFRAARAYEGLTAAATWRGLEPAGLADADDPAGPAPADRAAALAR
ncbi:MAG TPA: Asp-tRNA(Asn)/Glu-tRNA(Gln) amidotransferase subunit GatA [Candidatus Sulfomarinibacteraceae bacterium]|nr:Asp-tRNA(Asn)/Glu-tRNA(Gln) amidotransferase subunit GatA [Candidatus Sulfomarinibacteraceae bacterium]